MRVAHFAQKFSPVSQTFVYDSIAELERQGLDNYVLTIDRVNARERPFDNVHVIEKPARWHPRRLWHRLLRSFGPARPGGPSWPVMQSRMARTLRKINPDLIHAQFGPSGVLAAPPARAAEIPLVVTFHGYDVTRLPRKKHWSRAYQFLFERANLLVGVSRYICKKLSSVGAPDYKTKMLHTSVRLSQFGYHQRETSDGEETVECLYVGRLKEVKGVTLLLDAFRHARGLLSSTDPELRLTIAGDGNLRSKVEKKIRKCGLESCVELLGAVPHERVPVLMQKADLYAQHGVTARGGDQEGLGLSLIEASATGLPIVSTHLGGIPEVVAHGETGLLVQERDVEGMGRCIAELVRAPERRRAMGRTARRCVEEHFDLKTQMRNLTGLYEEVLA